MDLLGQCFRSSLRGIKIMRSKISRTYPSKFLWESKQKDEDGLKKILSKIVGLGIQLYIFPNNKKKKLYSCYSVLQHKSSNNDLWMIGGPLFFLICIWMIIEPKSTRLPNIPIRSSNAPFFYKGGPLIVHIW